MIVRPASIVEKENSEAKVANEASYESKIANEASTILPVGSSEQEIAPCPVTGTKTQDFSDTSRQLSCETVSSCVTTASEKMDEPQETHSGKVDQECTKEVGVAAVLCESIEKQGDKVAVSFTEDDKEAIQENHDKSSSKISGSKSSLSDSCTELHETGSNPANHTNNTGGVSFVFGSHPETEKDVNQVKASCHPNPSVSECINKDALNTSTDHDSKGNDASKDERNLAQSFNGCRLRHSPTRPHQSPHATPTNAKSRIIVSLEPPLVLRESHSLSIDLQIEEFERDDKFKEYWSLIETGYEESTAGVVLTEEQQKRLEELKLNDLKVKSYLFQSSVHDLGTGVPLSARNPEASREWHGHVILGHGRVRF